MFLFYSALFSLKLLLILKLREISAHLSFSEFSHFLGNLFTSSIGLSLGRVPRTFSSVPTFLLLHFEICLNSFLDVRMMFSTGAQRSCPLTVGHL